jgi:hypothetical protein
VKIIGAGFGRTGTLSTQAALNGLGYPCYHMFEVVRNRANKSHLDFWRQVANSPAGMQHDWSQVFSKYAATVDNPACCVWRELMQAYPDAKVLLTVHPGGPEAWYESTIDTIYFTENMWQFEVLRAVTPFGRKFGDMTHKLVWQRAHRGTMDDRDKAIAYYKQHIEDVRAAVPPDKLLIFSVDQGWKPLCDFLEVPIPPTAFPQVNSRTEIKQVLGVVKTGAYGILAGGAGAAAGLLYGLVQLVG